ncbi:hypothetical protein EVU97_14475 [Dermacoccus sp. 147Ba]|nr:hypothetical protein EVU97_14475 [Dermacoccus sp. 147Ba]
MCRALSDEHPRRCSCTPLASSDHNRRRRVNRQIVAGVAAWADALGDPAVDELRAGGIKTAQRWAEDHGAPMGSHPRHLGIVHDEDGAEREHDRRAAFGSNVAATLLASRVDEDDRALVDAPATVSEDEVSDGSNEVRVIELRMPDGSTSVGFHKPFDGIETFVAAAFGDSMPAQPMREVAAWHVARLLGPTVSEHVAPAVLREVDYPPEEFYDHQRTRIGSLSRQVPGSGLALTWADEVPQAQADAMAFFDAVIGNQDRHRANVFWDAETKSLGAFDHGYSFPRPAESDEMNESLFLEHRLARGRDKLTDAEMHALRTVRERLDDITPMLDVDRAGELRRRVEKMLSTGRLPQVAML